MGNVHTTGRFEGAGDFDPGTSVFNLTSVGEDDIFISKLGEAEFLWLKRSEGTGQDLGNDIFMDGAGNVYANLEGFFCTADFDPGPGIFNLIGVVLEDIFVYKLRSTYLVKAPLIFYNASPKPSR